MRRKWWLVKVNGGTFTAFDSVLTINKVVESTEGGIIFGENGQQLH